MLDVIDKAVTAGSIGPTALGGHAWLIELEAPDWTLVDLIPVFTHFLHHNLRGYLCKYGEHFDLPALESRVSC